MSTAKTLPKGLPALPPVPAGFDAWEYHPRFKSNGPVGAPWGVCDDLAEYLFRNWNSTISGLGHPSDSTVGNCDHYIVAIKRPAKLKQPKQAQAVKAKRVYGIFSEPETIHVTKKGAKYFAGFQAPKVTSLLVLPADAASVGRMREHIAGALEPYAKFPEVAANAVLASLGITSAKGRK